MFAKQILCVFFLLASAMAFTSQSSVRGSTALNMFNFGKKAPVKAAPAPSSASTYIPEGLTKAQYDAFLASEVKKKADVKKRFPKGKETESLTEWIEREAKKGNTGKGLLLKGHRMVKAKYEEFYTNESPV